MATTIRNQNLFCLNCGGEFVLKSPSPVAERSKKMKLFDQLHKDCEKTWTEPVADQNKPLLERAQWWKKDGERGMSSETMWSCFMGEMPTRRSHPSDPGDFKRCYKLLQAVPEWKAELHKLKSLSTPWSNLVDNWDTLTQMYEENIKTEWKNHETIGMYQLMEKLTHLF